MVPIIQSLLKGWGPKVTSHYLYTYWVITTYLRQWQLLIYKQSNRTSKNTMEHR